MRLITCYGPNCYNQGIKHPKSELTNFHGKNYCDKCLNEVMNDYEFRQSLAALLLEDYKSDYLPGIVISQIKKYRKIGMTYEGMYNTALWTKQSKGITFEKKYGIALIKYYYDDHAHYKENSRNNNQTKSNNTTVIISKPKRRHKQVREINGDDLLD